MASLSQANDPRQPVIEATAETPSGEPTKVEVMLGQGWRPWMSLFIVAFLLWLLITYGRLLAEVLAVVFGAYLLNLAIRPLAMRLAKRKIPPSFTVLLVYTAIFALGGLLVRFTLPTVVQEVQYLNRALPQIMSNVESVLNGVPILNEINLAPNALAESTEQELPTVANFALEMAQDAAHVLIDLTLVLVLTYIFVTDRSLGPDLLFTWVPKHRRWRVRQIFANTSSRLTKWLMAQIVIAAFFAILFGIGLAILGVPLAATIAVIGGLLEFIPFLGGAVSLTLASLVALAFKPSLVIWVVILYFVVNLIQVQVIQPFLYSRAVDAHPAAILIALLVGAQAGGVLGAMFAVPVAVVLMTLLDEIDKPGEAPADPHPPSPALPGEVGPANAAK